jgi:hypothetical protein
VVVVYAWCLIILQWEQALELDISTGASSGARL